ncbi:MAG: helix-turn-helix domain-containing protein [Gammaproteobacteria bacterium]|nr:helix-turn-helix domain-containing protein [Gammaproteobacteria bacterium]
MNQNFPQTAELLTPEQAAERLLVGVKTLAKWRCTGIGGPKFVKVGARVRYRVADLETYLAGRTFEHTAASA